MTEAETAQLKRMSLEKVETPYIDRWGEPQIEIRYRYLDGPQINADGKAYNGSSAAKIGPAILGIVLILIALGALFS